jgi:hypothetical protein
VYVALFTGKMLEKHLPANTLRNTKEVVDNIRTKVLLV